VVAILGPAGPNMGAGMTGGLAYILRADAADSFYGGHSNDDHINPDSVRFAALEPQEEQWLRRILRRHLQLTGSPRAAELLARSTLPLRRVEPLAPPCSIEETWGSILTRLTAEEARGYGRDKLFSSERPVVQ
jgi:glutamate synthase domain-containing protein 3